MTHHTVRSITNSPHGLTPSPTFVPLSGYDTVPGLSYTFAVDRRVFKKLHFFEIVNTPTNT